MLGTDSYKACVSLSSREAQIENSVSVSLSLSNELAALSLKYIDIMVIMSINHSD
jgi:hypothetical protein